MEGDRNKSDMGKASNVDEKAMARLRVEFGGLCVISIVVLFVFVLAAATGNDVIGGIGAAMVFLAWFPLLVASAFCSKKCERVWGTD